jgi:hypothetical protein
MAATRGMSWVTSLRLPPVSDTAGGIPCDGDHMMLRARLGAVDWARAGFGPPFIACTCELSITALDQSSAPAAFRALS